MWIASFIASSIGEHGEREMPSQMIGKFLIENSFLETRCKQSCVAQVMLGRSGMLQNTVGGDAGYSKIRGSGRKVLRRVE